MTETEAIQLFKSPPNRLCVQPMYIFFYEKEYSQGIQNAGNVIIALKCFNYFPKKEHNGIIYEAGEYESLVITLGQGEGDNFWCILFPPLCMVDENEDIEYKSIIKEVLKKIF